MGHMENAQEVFVAKIDAFAATLSPEEQAMFVGLLVGEDEVTGFGFDAGWPGLVTLGIAGSAMPKSGTTSVTHSKQFEQFTTFEAETSL